MPFSNEDKYNMFVIYCQNNFNSVLALAEYHNTYPNAPQPSVRYFQKLATNLRSQGSFNKVKRARQANIVNNPNKVNRILNYVNRKNEEGQCVSLRELQYNCNIRKDSASKILKKNGYRCYKIQKVHHLRDEDGLRRIRFCRWLLEKKREDPLITRKILWSDESNFSNNGFFNRNNHYKWTNQNTRWHRETALDRKSVV